MTDYTDNMAIPYPTAGDPAAGHLQMQSIATLVDSVVGSPWTDLPPSITGFNAGSFTYQARYKRIGNTVFYAGWVYVTVDNSQNGLVTVQLPVSSNGRSGRTLGTGFANTASGTQTLAAIQSGSALKFKNQAFSDNALGEPDMLLTFSTGNYLIWNVRYSAA